MRRLLDRIVMWHPFVSRFHFGLIEQALRNSSTCYAMAGHPARPLLLSSLEAALLRLPREQMQRPHRSARRTLG